MGTHKQAAIEKSSSGKQSRYDKKVARIQAIDAFFAAGLSNIHHTVEKGESECLSVSFVKRAGGEWMGIAKREGYPKNDVIFAFADTFFEVVDGLNVSISQDKWTLEKDRKDKKQPDAT